MRRFLLGLIALCFLALPAPAGGLAEELTTPAANAELASFGGTGGQHTGFWQAKRGGAAPTFEFNGCTGNENNLTIYTYTNHAIGTAAATRKVLVFTGTVDSATNIQVASMTIGGNAATELIDGGANHTGSVAGAAAYILDVAAGTTATIVVTLAESSFDNLVCVYSLYDVSSSTPTATASDFETSAAAATLSMNAQPGDLMFGYVHAAVALATTTWSGLTERVENSGTGSFATGFSAADHTAIAAETPRAISGDMTGTADVIAIGVSFR